MPRDGRARLRPGTRCLWYRFQPAAVPRLPSLRSHDRGIHRPMCRRSARAIFLTLSMDFRMNPWIKRLLWAIAGLALLAAAAVWAGTTLADRKRACQVAVTVAPVAARRRARHRTRRLPLPLARLRRLPRPGWRGPGLHRRSGRLPCQGPQNLARARRTAGLAGGREPDFGSRQRHAALRQRGPVRRGRTAAR